MLQSKLTRFLSFTFILLILLQTAFCLRPAKTSKSSTATTQTATTTTTKTVPASLVSMPTSVNCKELKKVACYAGKNEGYFCSKKDQTTTEIRWFYDKGVCRKFNYKGCYGNRNRFCTKESCEIRCGLID